MDWAADTGRLLAEFTTQLTWATMSRNQRQQHRILNATVGIRDRR